MVSNSSPFMKAVHLGTRVTVYFSLGLMLLAVLPGFPPYVSFKSFKVTPAVKLEGKLAPQYVLDKAVKVSNGEFTAAESIVAKGDSFYTGVFGGKILKVTDKKNEREVEAIAQIGKHCDGDSSKGEICRPGSPLGIRFDPAGNLAVIDATYGIASINTTTGKTTYYFTTETPLPDGSMPVFPNDLDIDKDNVIYWSQFSSKYTGEEFGLDKIGDSSGRLFKFDPKTNTNTELVSGLFGANGIQLSQNQDFVLVAESFRSRVTRYYLKGPKTGTSDVFVDGLPGLIDNIRSNGKGGFYIALFAPRVPLIDKLSQLPQLRKLVFRIHWLSLLPSKILSLFGIQNHFLSACPVNGYLGPWGLKMQASPMIVEVDAAGIIVRTLATTNKNMGQVTQLVVGDKFAYFGGFMNSDVWKLALGDLNPKL